MVGVPGKYKGCETCRRRRVKCSNERPFCQNCIKAGKTCEGYERARVFITGTPEGRGRVASHPKRVTPPKKTRTAKEKEKEIEKEEEGMHRPRHDSVIALEPLTSAWEDNLDLSNTDKGCSTLLTALHTSLHTIRRTEFVDDNVSSFQISLGPYSPPNLLPGLMDGGLWVSAQCLLCHGGVEGGAGSSPESYCVFLFENAAPGTSWSIASEGMVKGLGPSHFTTFPNHHFFVRVYRPMAVALALLMRRDTFVSGPDWMTIPWENHPKSNLDKLFDIVLALPAIFHQSDLLILQQPTLTRRFKAQQLLQQCLLLERRFLQWQQECLSPLPFWTDMSATGSCIPFENCFVFANELSAFMLLYFWMAQLLFHRCLEVLHDTMHQPVFNGFQEVWTEVPLNLQVDPERFRDGKLLADSICRGLDSALALTSQPDMLVAPMTVALDYYRLLDATTQSAALETLWLDTFRARLISKGQHVATVLQAQRWTDLASF